MSRELGSWIEVTVPASRRWNRNVVKALNDAAAEVGGATLTEAVGQYTRQSGEVMTERVFVVRWDFSIRGSAIQVQRVFSRTRAVVDILLALGEECVLRRRYYESSHRLCGYRSELIFKD